MTKPTGVGRGGARPGAGRRKQKRGPYKPKPIFDIAEVLREIPGGVRARATKTVLALAAFNASDEVIAETLSTDIVSLRAVHADDLARGRALMDGNVSVELLRSARGDGRRPSVAAQLFLLKRADRNMR